jgi:biopolymer transport protein TolQ
MNLYCLFAAGGTASQKWELVYIWDQATLEAKAIIFILIIFSIVAWSVMITKAIQMRRAKKLNQYFTSEFRSQKAVLAMFDRQEALKLESGLILLAIAVSGAPFLGLLGTVWGVMSTFGHIAQQGSATLSAMAPGVAAALITTVAGLLVAIPSMFGYNWLVHNLRVLTVELDNFAQEMVSKMETEYLEE